MEQNCMSTVQIAYVHANNLNKSVIEAVDKKFSKIVANGNP